MVLDRGGWSEACPGHSFPGKRLGTLCTECWVGPRSTMNRFRKSRPHRDSIHRPSSTSLSMLSLLINMTIKLFCYLLEPADGFGGLVVSILARNPSSQIQIRPKPLDFSGVRKILSMPSFGGEVKESAPCPSFAACKKS